MQYIYINQLTISSVTYTYKSGVSYTKARHLLGKPTHDDDVIMHLCALGDPLGRGGRGGRLPRPYLMSGCLTLWGKLHHLSLFIYTKFQGNLLVLDR